MTPRILLSATESWPSTALYAHGLAVAGCEVAALAPASAPAHTSPAVYASVVYRPLAPKACLQSAIDRFAPSLVVCCDERALHHLLALDRAKDGCGRRVTELIERSLGSPDRYARLLSRSTSLSELRQIGVRVAKTYPVRGATALDAVLAKIGFPAVLKADGSWGGDGVVIAQTREEAHRALRRLGDAPSRLRSLVRLARRRDLHFLLTALKPVSRKVSVQPFIDGQLAAAAFAADGGEVTASFCYEVLESREGGMGPPGRVQRVDNVEMEKAVRTVASHFKLSGAHGIDFIRDRAGRAYLIEINARATQGGTLPFGPGRDIAFALAQMVMPDATGIRPAVHGIVDFFRDQADVGTPEAVTDEESVPPASPQAAASTLLLESAAPRC